MSACDHFWPTVTNQRTKEPTRGPLMVTWVPGATHGSPSRISQSSKYTLPNVPSVPPAPGVEAVGEPPILFPPHLTRVQTCPPCIAGSRILCLHTRHGSTEALCVCSSPDHPEQSSLTIAWFLRARTHCNTWPLQSREAQTDSECCSFLSYLG